MPPAVRVTSALAIAAALLLPAAAAAPDPFPLDRAGERWVEQTLKSMTTDEKVGQLIVPSFESSFLSTDSDAFDQPGGARARLPRRRIPRVRRQRAGAAGPAESDLRHDDARVAAGRGVDSQPPAGAVARAADEQRGLRNRPRLPPRRRDDVSAPDGVRRRGRRRRSRARRGASRPRRRARSACR